MRNSQTLNFEPEIISYLKEFHFENLTKEKNIVTMDLNDLFHKSPLGNAILEYIINYPDEGICLLEKCYNEAFWDYNCERINITASIKNIPKELLSKIEIHEINTCHVGKLIEIDGKIKSTKKIVSGITNLALTCTTCGNSAIFKIENPFETSLERTCPKCSQKMFLMQSESKYEDFQELTLISINKEFLSKSTSNIEQEIILKNSPGIYNGIFRIIGIPYLRPNKKTGVFDIIIKGIYAEKIEDEK
ncbi:DNA replication protein; MCM family; putative [Methanococcus vannielii SB]|uniref:DNA replication protein MCM family putative n=1 Tax=Methanococcus vannielii (strain ATCC 35089 / DSM 1224 / JCM 13029 / OCM 148 / SB) TaxID=406327 RepID=A6USR0_METVS|nr:minichromosome maintenance protein MCM [Methanococcus vannielii]ABR55532.1 DNA replication protein; MCM family; putative [Methanococcus vannielii SB]